MTGHHRFPTDSPISVEVRVHKGTLRVDAVDTEETSIELSGRAADAYEVHQTSGGHRILVGPRRHGFGRHRVHISVRLPRGSELVVHAAAADVAATGPLAGVEVSCASGRVDIPEVDGRADVHSASGSVRLGTVRGPAELRSASGSLEVAHVSGRCAARTASGSIRIGTADDDVVASAASGSIRVGEVHRGAVDLKSTAGRVDVGVRKGTLVWLDAVSTAGRVRSDLQTDEPSGEDGAALTLRARSVGGSVSITSAGEPAIAL